MNDADRETALRNRIRELETALNTIAEDVDPGRPLLTMTQVRELPDRVRAVLHDRDTARAEADALRASLTEARATITRIAVACATIDCEDLVGALTPDDYDDLGGHVEALVASHGTYRATLERLQTNPLAKMLHRIPATEAPFELVYHPSDVGDPGWACVVAGYVDYGTLDAVIAAACERLGVSDG